MLGWFKFFKTDIGIITITKAFLYSQYPCGQKNFNIICYDIFKLSESSQCEKNFCAHFVAFFVFNFFKDFIWKRE